MTRNRTKHLGALWLRETSSARVVLSGVLELGGLGRIPIEILHNDGKKKDIRQPDYRIILMDKFLHLGTTDMANSVISKNEFASVDESQTRMTAIAFVEVESNCTKVEEKCPKKL